LSRGEHGSTGAAAWFCVLAWESVGGVRSSASQCRNPSLDRVGGLPRSAPTTPRRPGSVVGLSGTACSCCPRAPASILRRAYPTGAPFAAVRLAAGGAGIPGGRAPEGTAGPSGGAGGGGSRTPGRSSAWPWPWPWPGPGPGPVRA